MTGNLPTSVPPGVPANLITPQGNVPAIGIPNSQDYARLIFAAPYFEQIAIAEIIQPSVTEAVENVLPSLVPPYVDSAVLAGVQQYSVLLTGSTMTGPLFLSPLMPTQPSQAATMAYVDSMIATAGIPEVPPVPSGQVWARETGQWVPITPQTGVFLPLAGGSMVGNINMSGNTIVNMAAVPAMPNGAAPAQWVLNQIASVSLYQGTWNADTNVPDLTQLSTHVNAYTWIALTTSVSGVVIGQPIPGLQGMTVFNGDTIIYSTVQGQFMAIHAGGLTLPEADERYVQLGGSQMSGALLLNANASQPLQAVTLQQLQSFVPPGAVGEAPNDGQLYGRNGLTASWSPVLPLAGGILTGALTLAGNATVALNPVPLQQMTSAISSATAGLLPLSGGAMSGAMTVSGNATVGLNPVPLQQLNSMIGAYAPLSGATFTGPVTLPTGSTVAGYLPLAGGSLASPGNLTVGGTLNVTGISTHTAQANFNGGILATGAAAFIQQLIINSSATNAGYSMLIDGSNNRVLNWASGSDFLWAANNASLSLNLGNALAAIFYQGGNMGISGTLTQGSDATNKTNIEPIAQGISLIRQLTPKSFAWNSTPDTPQWGFIAQDVESVIPPAVSTSGIGLGLDVTAILAAVTMAVKQLDMRCTALEADVGLAPPADALA